MITQQLLEKFERYYGKGMARLVLFADWSGHTEVRDSAAWKYDFAFEDIAQLEAHLTRRAPDALRAYDMGEVNGVKLTYVNGNVFATPAKRR